MEVIPPLLLLRFALDFEREKEAEAARIYFLNPRTTT